MDTLVDKIKQRDTSQPTRADIAELLKSVGKPGTKLAEKEQAVIDLFKNLGFSQYNTQGHAVVTTLDSYEEM